MYLVGHNKIQLMYNAYNIFMFDNEHENQSSQCSSVPTYTLVVHNIALYRLGGAQDYFACLFISNNTDMMHHAMLSVYLSVWVRANYFLHH